MLAGHSSLTFGSASGPKAGSITCSQSNSSTHNPTRHPIVVAGDRRRTAMSRRPNRNPEHEPTTPASGSDSAYIGARDVRRSLPLQSRPDVASSSAMEKEGDVIHG